MNISLPAPMKAWLDRQVDEGQYGSASEYIRHLVRQAQVVSSRESIDEKLREALDGPASTPLTPADWKRIRRQGDRRVTEILLAQAQGGRRRTA